LLQRGTGPGIEAYANRKIRQLGEIAYSKPMNSGENLWKKKKKVRNPRRRNSGLFIADRNEQSGRLERRLGWAGGSGARGTLESGCDFPIGERSIFSEVAVDPGTEVCWRRENTRSFAEITIKEKR